MVQSMGSKSRHILTSLDRPFWLSPRQVLVIPVAVPYVRHLHHYLYRTTPEKRVRNMIHFVERVRI